MRQALNDMRTANVKTKIEDNQCDRLLHKLVLDSRNGNILRLRLRPRD